MRDHTNFNLQSSAFSLQPKHLQPSALRWGILFLVYLFLGGGIYANSLHNGFYYDDIHQIVSNDGIRHLAHLPSLFTSVQYTSRTSQHQGHYRPLVTASYLLNYAAGGLNPVGYHLVQISFHVAAACLTALVLSRLSGTFATGSLAGLLFLIHPFNAETINYITARSSEMFTVFVLLSFYAYLRFHPPRSGDGTLPEIPAPGSRGYLWVSLGTFILAMLSKEMAVTLPPLLILYEWILRRPEGRRDWLRALSVPLGMAVMVVVPYLLLRKALIHVSFGERRDMITQLATQVIAVLKTLYLFLIPVGLTVDHDVTVYTSFGHWPVLGGLLVLAGFLGLGIHGVRSGGSRGRLSVFLGAWFFVALVPVVVIPLIAILQENRAYLAVAGPAGFLAIGWVQGFQWAMSRSRLMGWGVLGILVVFLMSLTAATIERNTVWKDEISLWSDAVSKNPNSLTSLIQLGAAYGNVGRWDLSEEQIRKALAVDPDYKIATFNMGIAVKMQGRQEEAERWFRKTVRLDPGFLTAYYHLASFYEQRGRWEEAIASYREVVKRLPGSVFPRRRLADALTSAGRLEEAAREYETLRNYSGR